MTPKELIQFAFKLARDGEIDVLIRILQTTNEEVFEGIQQFLVRQGIAPILFYRILRFHYDRLLPKSFVDELQRHYLQNAARNLIASKQLKGILTCLEHQSVPVILLKGASFSFSIYKNPACRTMSDLDLLFEPTTVGKGVAELESLGYQMSGPVWEGPQHHLPPMIKQGYPFPVEVHRTLGTLTHAIALTPEFVWKTAQPGSLFGHPVLLLPPTITLFYICLHTAYQHLFVNSAKAIFDIDTLVRYFESDIDWDAFWGYAKAEDRVPGIAFIIKITAQLLSTPLPDKVIDKISSEVFPEGIEENIYEVMLSGAQLPDQPPAGMFTATKWWFNKLGKLSRSVMLSRERRLKNSLSTKTQAGVSLRRAVYVIKDYYSTAVQLRHRNQNTQKTRPDIKIRRWLKIP